MEKKNQQSSSSSSSSSDSDSDSSTSSSSSSSSSTSKSSSASNKKENKLVEKTPEIKQTEEYEPEPGEITQNDIVEEATSNQVETEKKSVEREKEVDDKINGEHAVVEDGKLDKKSENKDKVENGKKLENNKKSEKSENQLKNDKKEIEEKSTKIEKRREMTCVDARRDSRRDRHRERDRRSRSRSRNRRRSRSRSRTNRRKSRSLSNHRSRRNRYRSRSNERRRSRDRDRDRHSKRERSRSKEPEKTDPENIPRKQQKTVDILTSKTGGAYIPPAKLRALQAEITDKTSAAYQRIAWEALKKSIHGFINKVNVDNIGVITRQLLKENVVRGRGLLCRSIIQAQAASPTFTHVYAALVAVINSKFPNIGELLLHRLVIQFKRGFRRNDKAICISATRFIAHLINQRVAHEILALEILTLLVDVPTDDSVEVAIAFLKECGMKLQEVSSKGVNAIFEMLKNILHEGKLEKRVQYMIEVVFQVRKDGFKDHVAITEALELVEEDDQFTHLIMLDEATDTQDVLSKFH